MNNHHAFPGSARSGLRPFEIDPSWLMVSLMKMCGLVSWSHEESVSSKFKPRNASPDASMRQASSTVKHNHDGESHVRIPRKF